MRKQLRLTLVAALIIAVLLACRPAEAQIVPSGIGAASTGEVVGIIAGMVAAVAVVTIVVVYAVKHKPSITGCAVASPAGMTLQDEGNSQKFLLTGNTAGIKPGDRVKVQGKKQKGGDASARGFTVLRLKRDYGACPATP